MEILMILAICFFLLIILLIYMLYEAFSNRILYRELEFSEFPKTFGSVKIFFISDIHRRRISTKITDELMGKADLVIIGGDLLEKGVSFDTVKENIEKLKTIGPVFFVWGNNDHEVEVQLLDALLLNLGVKVLENSSVLFHSEEGERLFVIGVDEVSKNRDNLQLALQDTDPTDFKILLCHNPAIIEKIQEDHRIHLLLSGHTHGGQIRPFGIGLYPKGGIKKNNRMTILISNGYGTTGVPLRLGAKAETHFITIQGT